MSHVDPQAFEHFFEDEWQKQGEAKSGRGAKAKGNGTAGNAQTPLVLDPKDPMRIARTFVAARFVQDGIRILYYHRGAFYAWTGTHYRELTTTELRAGLYAMLERARRPAGEDKTQPFKPTTANVSNALDALIAVTHLSDQISPPAWLDGRDDPAPAELAPCRNGLLHLPTRRLEPLTPLFFGMNAVEFDFEPDAPEPEGWIEFLDSLWPDDPEAIATLQELMGYALTTETRQQKAFLLVGPKRSGKGTIARVLKALLGAANVAGPTLSALGTNFGLAPLIGKPLAVISDARLSGRADQHVIAERLLSITGEDLLTLDRKHREAWTGTLPTRFLLLTNELPRIADSSGALASRFIVLTLSRSFYGREDHHLTARLLGELPGILNWALEGYERLRARGRFVQPASSAEAIQDLEDLGSPISAFIRERCEVGPVQSVQCDTLFAAWKVWCEAQGRDHPGTAQTFGRDLRAAVPALRVTRPRDQGRARVYEGIGLA